MRTKLISATALGALFAAGLFVAPTLAQSVGEITVMGKYNADTRSAAVSYADLDLTTSDGMKTLNTRVRDTAHDLCSDLTGAQRGALSLMQSCEGAAVAGAADQIKLAEASHRNRALAILSSPAPAPAPEAVAIADPPAIAPSAPAAAQPASFTSTMVSNGPVPDTPENRAKYGQPMSNAGKRTAPAGN